MQSKENRLKFMLDNIGENLEVQYKNEGKQYNGQVSIVEYLVNYYFTKLYDTGECEYILRIKSELLCIELLSWLKSNYNKNKLTVPNNWFKTELKKIDIEIEPFKKDLYDRWKLGLFNNLIKKFKQKTSLSERELLCIQFIQRYEKYDIKKDYQIRQEIGLKSN